MTTPVTEADVARLREALRPCPFCGGEVMHRLALWPNDGNTDAIIHAEPTECGMQGFDIGTADGGKSVAFVWNTRPLDQLEAKAASVGWEGIESAPKDGTMLIGWRADQGTFPFRWAWMEEVVPHNASGDPIGEYDEAFECWFHDVWGWLENDLAPTAWQLFPTPPEDTDKSGDVT